MNLNPALRTVLLWALGLLLIVYVAGTLRLAWPLLTGQGTRGAPVAPIVAGFYMRLVLMGIILYLFERLRRGRPPRR